jgi:hypothetical protein
MGYRLSVSDRPAAYKPMTLVRLAAFIGAADGEALRWRLIAEFLEEYRWEPPELRARLLEEEPALTGDEHWDVFVAALAEHLALRDHRAGPQWAQERSLDRFWFPFNTPAARVDAVVHAPVAFRRRGVFVAPQELEVA